MPITTRCPTCDAPVRIPDRLSGKTVNCPQCGMPFSTRLDVELIPAVDVELMPERAAPPHAAFDQQVDGTPFPELGPVLHASSLPDNFGQPETASLRTLGNNLKRFLSFPWLFACFLFGFLPWSEVACNSKNVNWRVTQSGYQAVYGGVSSPFDTVATAKEAIDREVGENQKLLAKTLETERSGFLMSCSPHSLIFWEFGLAALLFISFIPLSGLRLTCCSAFAGMMLLMLVLELVVGSPLERRIDSIIHEQIRENPTAAMQAAMAVASGKTVWFWLVLTAAFFFGLSELLTNYLWKSYQSFSPAIPVFILISTVAFIIAGVSVQVSLWQNGITWMETRLASLHQIEQQKKNAQAEAEYRRLERKRQEEERRQQIEKRKREELQRRQALQELEMEKQQMEIARQEQETAKKERERQEGLAKIRKEEERLENLSETDMKEIRTLLKGSPAKTALGLKTVIRLGSKGEEALPEVLDLVDSQRTRGQALKALEAIGRASIPGLVEIMKKQTAAEKLEIATLLISIDKRDKRVTDAVVPVLVAALRPKDINEPVCRPVIELIKTVGKPCVKEIFKALAAADDQGGVNANNRKFLFMALEQLGAEAYSEDNVERLRQYKQKEKFVDVQAAATKAILAMSSR